MKHVLLILAAGKSSRFGGYPKAFCKVGGKMVAQRTAEMGAPYFDETYLAINKELFGKYKNSVNVCKILAIATGQGDAHSFLRAARKIRDDCGAEMITLCWGDTFYLDDRIFRKAAETEPAGDSVGVALCAVDDDPYAWFETDGDRIKASHFRSDGERVNSGIHDQSVFVFNLGMVCSQIESYMKYLGIRDEEDFINHKISREMKLLKSFTYFYDNGLPTMKYTLVEAGISYSFNTQEELEKIKGKVEKVCIADYAKHGRG